MGYHRNDKKFPMEYIASPGGLFQTYHIMSPLLRMYGPVGHVPCQPLLRLQIMYLVKPWCAVTHLKIVYQYINSTNTQSVNESQNKS